MDNFLDMDVPKIVIQVELTKNYGVKFTSLEMHHIFIKNFGEQYITENKWRFLIANDFQVVETLTILPEIADDEVYNHECRNETERYKYLKSFSEALLNLSKEITSNYEENFAEKPYIKTQGNLWLVF